MINIFEKSFKDIIEIYNGNNKKCGIFDEFITLKDDIIELELKEKENYVNSYKYVAENFINIIEEIEERNPTKDKIIKWVIMFYDYPKKFNNIILFKQILIILYINYYCISILII